MKINLYRFITSVCLFPTFDWAAFGQRIAGKIFSASLFLWLLSFLKTPLFFIGLVALLTYSPDTLAWIFIKIGEIEISIMAMLLSALMPDLFSEGGSNYGDWASIWNSGLGALPSDVVDIINGLGVAQILGLVTVTWTVISVIKIYRKVMLRAGRI